MIVSPLTKIYISKIDTNGFNIDFSNIKRYKDDIINADYIIAGPEPYTKEMLEKCKNLKMISACSHGTDHIDKSVVPVVDCRGSLDTTIAEITIGYMICALRDIIEINETSKQQAWLKVTGNTLSGKTIGIIGYGGIGQELARLLEPFNVKMCHYDIIRERSNTTLPLLLENSDIITLHCDLNETSHHLINEDVIKQMKDDMILINTSRGKVINEKDLYKNLNKFKYVILDVFEEEPPLNNILRTCNNVICGMHTACASEEGMLKMAKMSFNNIVDYEHRIL